MEQENFINFNDPAQLDSYIYRIISVERLFQLFTDRRNVLIRPSKWDDPFENFVLNAQGRLRTGEVVAFGFNNDFYGQCWTLHRASDAMWRIYSPDSKGVRIRTTVRRLAKSLANPLYDWAHVQCFIGKVKYLNMGQLLKCGNTVFENGLDPLSFAQTLLVKRLAFAHESEVRLLYFQKENRDGGDLYSYEIDPHKFIDQIMVDSRLSREDASAMIDDLRKRTEFAGPIKRSFLYAPPRKMMTFPIGD